MKKMNLVVVRHGESQWNQENRFTGWVDVALAEKGRAEALRGGKALREKSFTFDIVYTSLLKRAIHTMDLILDSIDQVWLPVIKDWRLNERHYGSLQGLNKAETAAKYGEDQVKIWRRSFDIRPPLMAAEDSQHPAKDPRYQKVSAADLPSGESLKDTIQRFLPLWNEQIKKDLQGGKKVLVVAHGNSLRSLIKNLESISDKDIMELNMPTGIPLAYHLDGNLKVIDKSFIGDPGVVAAAMEQVASQGKAKPNK